MDVYEDGVRYTRSILTLKLFELEVGGAQLSQHLTAKAGDLKVSGMSTDDLRDTIIALIDAGKMKQGGVGRYDTFVHYDIRGTKARWGA